MLATGWPVHGHAGGRLEKVECTTVEVQSSADDKPVETITLCGGLRALNDTLPCLIELKLDGCAIACGPIRCQSATFEQRASGPFKLIKSDH